MARNTRPLRALHNLKAHQTSSAGPQKLRWACDEQREFFEYGPSPVCASGGYGASKTFAGCLKALYLSDTFPHNRGLIARRKWTELQKTTMPTFFKLCPPEAYSYGGRRADSEKILRLNNGSEIIWAHMDDPETENLIRGLEINWFLLDQAEEIDEDIFEHLLTRLGRWDRAIVPSWLLNMEASQGRAWTWYSPDGRPIPPTYGMILCNPDHELHWIYKRFHPESRDWDDQYRALGYKMIFMDSAKNRFLPQQNKDELMSKDPSFVRRFVRGQWGVKEGKIHDVSPLSIIDGSPELYYWVLANCTLHRVLDHGDSAPTCCTWWGVDGSGNCICYREYYQPNRLISQHRESIAALSENESYQFQLADPSIFNPAIQKQGRRFSVADEYADVTSDPSNVRSAIFWQKADNNELGTRNRISEYLRVDPQRIHPFTHNLGSPRLFFLKRNASYPQGCDYAIRELQSQKREKIGSDLGKPRFSDDRDEKVPDHSYDTIRYFIASRPPVFVSTKKPAAAGPTFETVGHEIDRVEVARNAILKRVARRLNRYF